MLGQAHLFSEFSEPELSFKRLILF